MRFSLNTHSYSTGSRGFLGGPVVRIGGHGNPLQYSCLESPMDGGVWWATGLRVAQSETTEMS